MLMEECIKCLSKNSILKNVELKAVEKLTIKNLFLNSELFYLKICLDCGYAETYSSAIVDKNIKKNKVNKLKK